MLESLWFATALGVHPGLNDQYTVFKWTIVFALSGAGLLGLASRGRRGVRLPAGALVVFFALIGAELPAHVSSGFAFSLTRSAEWAAFGAVVLVFLQTGRNLTIWPRAVAALVFAGVLVTVYGFIQIFGLHLPGLWRNEFPSSFFGFQNMTAECVGLALVGSLWLLVTTQGKRTLVWLGASVLLVGYLWFLKSRAAYLGLGLALPILLLVHRPFQALARLAAVSAASVALVVSAQWVLKALQSRQVLDPVVSTAQVVVAEGQKGLEAELPAGNGDPDFLANENSS